MPFEITAQHFNWSTSTPVPTIENAAQNETTQSFINRFITGIQTAAWLRSYDSWFESSVTEE